MVPQKGVSGLVFRLLMECWAASPLEGSAGWALLVVAGCLGFILNVISVLISALGSSSVDLGILSGTVVLGQLPTSHALHV